MEMMWECVNWYTFFVSLSINQGQAVQKTPPKLIIKSSEDSCVGIQSLQSA